MRTRTSRQVSIWAVLAISAGGGLFLSGLTLFVVLFAPNFPHYVSPTELAVILGVLFFVGSLVVFRFAAMMYWQERRNLED